MNWTSCTYRTQTYTHTHTHISLLVLIHTFIFEQTQVTRCCVRVQMSVVYSRASDRKSCICNHSFLFFFAHLSFRDLFFVQPFWLLATHFMSLCSEGSDTLKSRVFRTIGPWSALDRPLIGLSIGPWSAPYRPLDRPLIGPWSAPDWTSIGPWLASRSALDGPLISPLIGSLMGPW